MSQANLDALWDESVAIIQGLGLTFGIKPVLVPVVKRKLPKRDEQPLDPSTQITVWASIDAENVKYVSFNGWLIATYNLEIAIVSPNNGDEVSNLSIYTVWRQRIRQQFQGPRFDNLGNITDQFGNISKILDVDSSKDVFLDKRMVSDLYDYQTVGVAVKVVEPSSS